MTGNKLIHVTERARLQPSSVAGMGSFIANSSSSTAGLKCMEEHGEQKAEADERGNTQATPALGESVPWHSSRQLSCDETQNQTLSTKISP